MTRVVVVGGGAAGLFAALRCKELNRKAHVEVMESAPQPLGKVRISGGGRCNVTHACFDLERLLTYYPRGADWLRPVLARFGPQDTVNWFQAHGVRLKTEADGRMFPVTDDSATIIDCLLDTARKMGVRIETGTTVKGLYRDGHGFRLEACGMADAVVVATGGARRTHAWLTQLGHEMVPPVPSLFTFNIQDARLEGLAGVAVPRVRATLLVDGHPPVCQEGPLLVTHWGLSGPVILRLSAWGARALFASNYQATLRLDLCPEDVLRPGPARKQVGTDPPVPLPRRLWKALAGPLGSRPWGSLSRVELRSLNDTIQACEFAVLGKGVFKEEFVTAGGLSLEDVDARTMQSRHVPGLYLAGEVLDVDGLTGGFNFQHAWASGWIAGSFTG